MQITDTERDALLTDIRTYALRRANRILPPLDAEEAAQDAVVAVWRSLDRMDPTTTQDGSAWPYASRTARLSVNRTAARLYERRAKREVPTRAIGAWDVTDGIDSTAGTGLYAGLRGRIVDALRVLPKRQREAVVMMDMHGMRAAEVCAVWGVTEPAGVYAARRDGRKALAVLLGDLA